jgi:uncharacterized protein YdaU (DUF1376 family)
MNYYPFHLGDYTAHTAHLEPLEDLAYRRMLDAYYLREGPLPIDPTDVARLIRMRGHLAEVQSVLDEFFTQTDDGWRHPRCDEEIERMQDKQAKARASAAASVNARKAKAQPTPSEGKANAERTLNDRSTDVELPTPTPTPTPTSIPNGIEKPNAQSAGDGFAKFWAAYPKKVGKQAAEKAWAKLKRPAETLDVILKALEWQRKCEQWTKDGGQYVPNPTTYLNQGRWLDEPTAGKAPRVYHDISGMNYTEGVDDDGKF